MPEPAEVYRVVLEHRTLKDCPSPRWVGEERVLGAGGVLLMPQGAYRCPGHQLEGHTRGSGVVRRHILKEVAP